MTDLDKKQLSTAMEDVAALINRYAVANKCSDVLAADILKITKSIHWYMNKVLLVP